MARLVGMASKALKATSNGVLLSAFICKFARKLCHCATTSSTSGKPSWLRKSFISHKVTRYGHQSPYFRSSSTSAQPLFNNHANKFSAVDFWAKPAFLMSVSQRLLPPKRTHCTSNSRHSVGMVDSEAGVVSENRLRFFGKRSLSRYSIFKGLFAN